MSFREKLAWLQLVTSLLVFGVYFTIVGMAFANGHPQSLRGLLVAATLALTILIVPPIVIMAIRAPSEANQAEDERERFIRLRATQIAWGLLNALVWCLAVAGIWLQFGSILMGNLAIGALVLADLVRWGTQIVLSRQPA